MEHSKTIYENASILYSKINVLIIVPSKLIYGFNARTGSYKFEPEMEKLKIKGELSPHLNISLQYGRPNFKDIKEVCIKNRPQFVIFYTHALLQDQPLNDTRDPMNVDILKNIFQAVRDSIPSFEPIILFGACFSNEMAKQVHKGLKHPVIGFEGFIYPNVITQYIIQMVLSFSKYSSDHVIPEKLDLKKIMNFNQHRQARIYTSESLDNPWIRWFKNYIYNNQDTLSETIQRFGFFYRIVSSVQWPHFVLENPTPHCFIGTIQVKSDPIQLIFIDMKSTSNIFLGREMSAILTLYSDCEEGGFWKHPNCTNREVPAFHSFVVKEKHFLKKSEDTIENIPGFEMDKKILLSEIKRNQDIF